MYRSDKDIINERQFLCEDELFYKNLVKVLPDAIFLEKNEKFIFANDEAIKLLGGIYKEDILGKKVMEFLDEKFLKAQEELCTNIVENNEEVVKEKKIVKLNGEVIDVEVTPTISEQLNALKIIGKWCGLDKGVNSENRTNGLVVQIVGEENLED